MSNNLKEDVTIVISVKDTYYMAEPQLDAVLELSPGVPVIYMLSEPINKNIKLNILKKQGEHSHVMVIDTGLYFSNPYILRNLAIPYIQSKYTMFIFNDVVPLGPGWLSGLHEIAEEKPDVDIFQPFIWEEEAVPHAAWSSIRFHKTGDNYYVEHTFDMGIKAITDPATELEPAEQPYFLEDHAFLVRTAYLKEQSILDPGTAYTREYLDMALSAKYRNSRIWSVPSAQVHYKNPYKLGYDDVLIFAYRRSEELCLGSTAYLCNKWGVRYWTGRIWKNFKDKQLHGIKWNVEQIPGDFCKQLELLLAMLTLIGFNRFSLSFKEGNRIDNSKGLTVPEAYRIIEHLAEIDHPGPVSVLPGFSQEIPDFEVFSNDHQDRHALLKSGHLFPVQESARDVIDDRNYMLAYEPFFMLECFDLLLDPVDAMRLFEGIPSLMLEKKLDAGLSRFKVYLFGRLAGQQKFRIERFAKDLRRYRDSHTGIRICGHFYADGNIRYVSCTEVSVPPIELGRDREAWKVFYWSWIIYDHDQLVELFHLHDWRSASRKILRRVYRYIRVTAPFRLLVKNRS